MLIQNRKAYHNYRILEEKEAGVALLGAEVKSLRAGQANLNNTFIHFKKNGVFLVNAHIAPYSFSHQEIDSRRSRRLLLKQQEILSWQNKVKQQKLTIVPLEWYNKGNLIKLKIGLGKKRKIKDSKRRIKN